MTEYNFSYFEEKSGKVHCQICGKPYLVISPRHLQSHKIKYSEYKLRFPDAPLSCEEFGTVSKYGKEKGMFLESEEVIIDEKYLIDEAEIEEIAIDTVLLSSGTEKIDKLKGRIFDDLRSIFSNVKVNYMIREKLVDGRTLFEFITDFADPVLKIDLEFPNTFWHNKDQYIDLNRDRKLKERGWKVIKIKGNNPSLTDIENEVKNI